MVGSIEGVYKFANQVERAKTRLYLSEELQDLGFNIVIYPVCTIFAAAKAIQGVLADLKANHTTRGSLDQMTSFAEYNIMVGMEELLARERQYKVDETRGKLINK